MMGLLSNLTGNIKARYQSCLYSALFGVAAGFFALIACGFFTAGGFIYLLEHFSPAETSLIVGGFYMIVAMLILSFMAVYKDQKALEQKAAEALRASSAANDAAITRLIEDITTNGFKPSQLGLLAGLPAFKSVNPKYMALAVLVAGFVSGRKMRS